jgi:hypothetical protein
VLGPLWPAGARVARVVAHSTWMELGRRRPAPRPDLAGVGWTA